jgi:hypothetical protein
VGPRSGMDDVEKRKFLTLPEFVLWHVGRPAHSQSLCRLRYPGSISLLGILDKLESPKRGNVNYLQYDGRA